MADYHPSFLFILEILEQIDAGTYLVLDSCLEEFSNTFSDNLFQKVLLSFFSLSSASDGFLILHGRILPSLLATGNTLRFSGSQ